MANKSSWISNRWHDFIEFIKKGFPWIVCGVGCIMFFTGYFKLYKFDSINDLVFDAGKVFLGSWLFTFMIKSFQYNKVFQEEIEKVITDPYHLANRKDLQLVWIKLSKTLFRDKFKNISSKLLLDIMEFYLPIRSVYYFDKAEHNLEISVDNKKTGATTLQRRYKMEAIAENPSETYEYQFDIVIPYDKKEADVSYNTTIKINGIEQTPICTSETPLLVENTQCFVRRYTVSLHGSEKYTIEKTEVIKYNIYFDNIIFFQANKIYNALVVNVHFDKTLFNLEFRKSGTLNKFVETKAFNSSERYSYEGIIFPQQGYYISIKRK